MGLLCHCRGRGRCGRTGFCRIEGKAFFFEKKKQKTFVSASRTQRTKFFWFFFSSDALARYLLNTTGAGAGLRGGRFSFAPDGVGYKFHLDRLRWTADEAVSGTASWNQLDGRVRADITLAAGSHTGALSIDWQDLATDAAAHISGQIAAVEQVAP